MEHTHPLPFGVAIDDTDDPADVMDAMVLDRFLAGAQPFSRWVRLSRVRAAATLLPPGATPMWLADGDGRHSELVSTDEWTILSVRWSDNTAHITVTATSDALAKELVDVVTEGATEPATDDDGTVTVGFWHHPCGGRPRRAARGVKVPAWADIRRNYSASVTGALDELMAVRADTASGRLILLHGPPGTGKTTALRALAREWRSWCRLETVLDPEKLFTETDYLLHLVLRDTYTDYDDDGDVEDGHRWRLLLLEDCDELIRTDAKSGSGQALARLLNLTDGLAGEGLDILVAITTNEPLWQLHPAVVRPGRCMAEVMVGPLSPSEASAWLGAPVSRAGALTLAELFAKKGALHTTTSREPLASAGQYM